MRCSTCRWFAKEAPDAPNGSCMHAPPTVVLAGMQQGLARGQVSPIILSLRPTVDPGHYCAQHAPLVPLR